MRSSGEIKSLTGIRGLAAVLVVLYHTATTVGVFAPIMPILLHGYIAVDLFFVLSGFVMAMTYRGAFAGKWGAQPYVQFLFKRLGRVYPLYAVLVAVTVVVNLLEGTAASAGHLAANLLLVQGWGFDNSIVGPSWSISTEFMAYILFPGLVAVMLHPKPAWPALGTAVAAGLLMFVATRSSADLHQLGAYDRNGPLDVWGTGTAYPLLRCLAGFALGLLSFRLWSVPAVRRVAARPFAADLVFAGVVVLMFIHGSDVALVLLFVPLVIALASGRSLTARTMETAVVYWLGLISYSIYLVHRIVFDEARDPIFRALGSLHVPHAYTLCNLLTFTLLLLLSTACFYGIEKPGRDWSRRLLGLRSRPIASEPAAP